MSHRLQQNALNNKAHYPQYPSSHPQTVEMTEMGILSGFIPVDYIGYHWLKPGIIIIILECMFQL